MKVSELIKKLMTYEGDLEVEMNIMGYTDGPHFFGDIETIYYDDAENVVVLSEVRDVEDDTP